MSTKANHYCLLERFSNPDCWNSIFETYEDFQLVKHRMQELWEHYKDTSDAGISVKLLNRWGGELHVGISDDGWLLIMRNKGEPTRIIRGVNQLAEGYVSFLLPERTDFERHLLLSPLAAEPIIKSWLDSGTEKEKKGPII